MPRIPLCLMLTFVFYKQNTFFDVCLCILPLSFSQNKICLPSEVERSNPEEDFVSANQFSAL